jgi:arthrofactin-type cyclic lipopeptide synthetase C
VIGGDGLARGYLNRPELTAERFVVNPFGGGSSRLYRTGDRARFHADGMIEFLGRLDSQVKVRGYRIELSDIEHSLSLHPDVREAIVMLRDDSGGEGRLTAYWIRRPDAQRRSPAFREFLRERLPEHMVPSFFVEIESWPLTPNGKIDRKALPAPGLEHAIQSGRSHEPPRGEVELQLAAIWKSTLNLNRVGADDNFFELGGHSLLAARLFQAP